MYPSRTALLAPVLSAAVLVPAAHAQEVINVGPGDVIASGTDLPSGATVNVLPGGTVGLGVDFFNGTLNISGGNVALGATSIASGFTNSGNTVTISGGNVGPFFQFFDSDGLITGGQLDTFGVFSGSTVRVEGGTVTGFPDVFGGGRVEIAGGDVNTFRALAGSTVELIGTEFALGGTPIDIEIGESLVLNARNALLTATLSDGSFFDHGLRSFDPGFPTPDIATNSSTIILSRVVPSPGGASALLIGVGLVGTRRRRA